MEILLNDDGDVSSLLPIFNTHLRDLPYAGPVTEEQLQFFLQPAGMGLANQKLLVAKEQGETCGFAHVATMVEKERPGQQLGVIRVLVYPRGQRSVGQSLLNEAESYLKLLGVSQLRAFASLGYRFIATAGLPDRWEHVQALFAANDYELREDSVFMHWRDYEVEKPICPDPSLRTAFREVPADTPLPNIWAEVFRGENRVAGVKMDCFAAWATHPEAAHTCYTDAFGVSAAERGKGLGRYVLLVALEKMKEMGYRHAALDVKPDNYPALLLYAGMGYRRVFASYCVSKDERCVPVLGS